MIEIINNQDALEKIDALIKYYFKCSFFELELMEDGIYFRYDTSLHGSPHYQYKLITNDKNMIEIYDHLMKLRDFTFKCDK